MSHHTPSNPGRSLGALLSVRAFVRSGHPLVRPVCARHPRSKPRSHGALARIGIRYLVGQVNKLAGLETWRGAKPSDIPVEQRYLMPVIFFFSTTGPMDHVRNLALILFLFFYFKPTDDVAVLTGMCRHLAGFRINDLSTVGGILDS